MEGNILRVILFLQKRKNREGFHFFQKRKNREGFDFFLLWWVCDDDAKKQVLALAEIRQASLRLTLGNPERCLNYIVHMNYAAQVREGNFRAKISATSSLE